MIPVEQRSFSTSLKKLCRRLSAAALLFMGLTLKAQAQSDQEIFTLIVYDHGGEQQIAVDAPEAKEVVRYCEDLLRTADGILRLAVSPELIEGILQQERALEIRYPEPQTFSVLPNGYQLHVSKLLIPLSGEFAEGSATIFHGNAEYGHGPYRNSKKSPAELESLLKALR